MPTNNLQEKHLFLLKIRAELQYSVSLDIPKRWRDFVLIKCETAHNLQHLTPERDCGQFDRNFQEFLFRIPGKIRSPLFK